MSFILAPEAIGRRKDAFECTGGTETTVGTNRVHTFLSSGTFTVTSGEGDIDLLLVAGGGGVGVAGGGVVIGHNYVQLDYASDSGEDDDWWNDRNYIQSGVKVEVSADGRTYLSSVQKYNGNFYTVEPIILQFNYVSYIFNFY